MAAHFGAGCAFVDLLCSSLAAVCPWCEPRRASRSVDSASGADPGCVFHVMYVHRRRRATFRASQPQLDIARPELSTDPGASHPCQPLLSCPRTSHTTCAPANLRDLSPQRDILKIEGKEKCLATARGIFIAGLRPGRSSRNRYALENKVTHCILKYFPGDLRPSHLMKSNACGGMIPKK